MSLNQRISPNLSETSGKQQAQACRQGGFTLIELMVVITILGILAGIASGAYLSIRDSYRAETATSQLRSILTSARLNALSRGEVMRVTLYNFNFADPSFRNTVSATHLGGVYNGAIVTGAENQLEGVYMFNASTLNNTCQRSANNSAQNTVSFSARATVGSTLGAPSILISSDAAGTVDMHCLQIRTVTGRVSVLKP